MIPELQIKKLSSESENFLSIGLEELVNGKKSLISSSHRTSYFQLVIVSEGEADVWIDEKRYHCGAKSLLALPKGSISLFNFSKNATGYVIFFSEDYIYRYPEDIEWINNLMLFDTSELPIVALSETKRIELLNLYLKIELEFKGKPDFMKDDIILNLLKTFLLMAERIKRNEASNEFAENKNNTCITEFRKRLEEHYRNSRSVYFYADLLNVTPRKLNQIVSNHMGKSTKKIIEERILLESKRLLAHTDRTVKEIGTSLGFSDPTNFNKFFRKYFHSTPAEFRFSIKTKNHYKTTLNNHF